MDRVPPQTRAVLLQFQFLAASTTADGVVVVAGFFADQKHGDDFLLALGHSQFSAEVIEVLVSEIWEL